jgi:hypothetical protein
VTDEQDPSVPKAPPEDPWTATLRRNREAAELIRQRLAKEMVVPISSTGIPCE